MILLLIYAGLLQKHRDMCLKTLTISEKKFIYDMITFLKMFYYNSIHNYSFFFFTGLFTKFINSTSYLFSLMKGASVANTYQVPGYFTVFYLEQELKNIYEALLEKNK